jgi:hypothetical protein
VLADNNSEQPARAKKINIRVIVIGKTRFLTAFIALPLYRQSHPKPFSKDVIIFSHE